MGEYLNQLLSGGAVMITNRRLNIWVAYNDINGHESEHHLEIIYGIDNVFIN